MKHIVFPAAFAALLTALPAASETETFTVDPNHTFPFYEIGHFGNSFQRGRFDNTRGKIVLASAATSGSAEIVILSASVDTGVPERAPQPTPAAFFNADTSPPVPSPPSSLH